MKKLLATTCLFIVTSIATVSFIIPTTLGQEQKAVAIAEANSTQFTPEQFIVAEFLSARSLAVVTMAIHRFGMRTSIFPTRNASRAWG
jgi:hypothetical protein